MFSSSKSDIKSYDAHDTYRYLSELYHLRYHGLEFRVHHIFLSCMTESLICDTKSFLFRQKEAMNRNNDTHINNIYAQTSNMRVLAMPFSWWNNIGTRIFDFRKSEILITKFAK